MSVKEVGPDEASSAEVGFDEVSPSEVGIGEVGSGEVGSGEDGGGEVSLEASSREVGPAEGRWTRRSRRRSRDRC